MLSKIKTLGYQIAKDIIKSTPFSSPIKIIYDRYKIFNGDRHPIQNTKTKQGYSLVHLGTEYGGWTFVDDGGQYNSQIISAGLGEDASFDIEFAQKYDSKVIIVDPTPRSIQHFEKIKQSIGSEKTKEYNQSGKQPVEAYELSCINDSQLTLIQKALWNEQGEIKFHEPEIESHVSYSITNRRNNHNNDTDYIFVQSDTITSIINSVGINQDKIDLVKLDIEGAEIEVICQMMDQDFTPKQILVEFDELRDQSKKAFERVNKAHQALNENGYELIHTDGVTDFLYYRDNN